MVNFIHGKTSDHMEPSQPAVRENGPNTELFLVRIFLYSDWMQENRDQK